MTITKKVGKFLGWKWEQTKFKTACGEVTTIIMVREKLKPLAEVDTQSLIDAVDDNDRHQAYKEYLREEGLNGLI
jgi:hypothetical protein